ncbi:MAG: SAM-dependent methyltransferase [Prolixibacteraceae bacterium]|nr:SAM-dependent methyltransferase [Prolixibacteraceae bacterium]
MIGKIILVPTTLGDENPYNVLPSDIKQVVSSIKYYFVENTRTARRFLKKIDIEINIDDRMFFEINKRTRRDEMEKFMQHALKGDDIAVISEAGCPGIADPGADVVKLAHQKNLTVKPLVGPSSILLSLMASGMNGQSFSFVGYIPIKQPSRSKTLHHMQQQALKYDQTQILIETPYRNNALIEELLKTLNNETRLCIACDLTLETEYIKTHAIKDWKKQLLPDLHKRPAIFLIGK